MKKKPAFFQTRTRYCVKFDEDALSFLRPTANLQEDESVLMLIDDSLRAQRTKNIVFTDRRILWQEKRGAPFKELLLERLNGASVFATSCGLTSIVTVLNGDVCVSFRFKNIQSYDALRIVFHDYLSRHCENYIPFGAENEARYEKKVLAPFKRKRIASTFSAAAGSLALILFVLADCFEFDFGIQFFSFFFAVVFWTLNMFLPASKSKLTKTFLLYTFTVYAFVSSIMHFLTYTLLDKIAFIVCAAAFLKIDLFETDGTIKVTSTYITILSFLIALSLIVAMLYA